MPAREGAWAIYDPLTTADHEQIFVGITSDAQWQRFCEHFGRDDLLHHPSYQTNEDRVRERPALLPIVAAIVAQHTRQHLAELFDRLDIPFAPVAKPGDLFDDPQLNAGGRMLDIDFAGGTRAKLPRLPIEMGDHDFGLAASRRSSANIRRRSCRARACRLRNQALAARGIVGLAGGR